MSKYSKVLYLCAILLLGWLAAKPYWPAIREEVENFYAAWQAARSTQGEADEAATTEIVDEAKTRTRSIAPPKPAAELPLERPDTIRPTKLDPFLAEARERAKADPEAAMQWLQEQSTGAERLRGMLEVVALWAAKDSESALLWLESNAQGIARLETLNSGVELWAQRDPKAAANWIDGMANDGSKIAAAKSLASTWVKTNPAEASAWVEGLPSGGIRNEAAAALALSWLKTDAKNAETWVQKEYRQSMNHALVGAFIGEYATTAPDAAESFIRDITIRDPFGPNGIDPTLINKFVETRAKTDPAGTADWLGSLGKDDPFYSPSHARGLMSTWAETDSVAASAWLSEQPLGRERDAAIVGFTETILKFEPEAAVAWADSISEPETRINQLTETVQVWARTKPKAALEWVINSDLEPALQEQLAREIGVD